VAVGDGGNDIEMLRWAGRGVAMGGSRWDVVAAADEETSRIEHDGLARVIDTLF
ncbi:MAG: HAD hydrolase family protein, partial [Bifidobacteriaceae bacterium]|jgi:hydroxymethylpyrimidine pyrophosphatase-like HAD family hydrolase|nr:HAD hydrolase family protein [Bifidobacteriaceae bacterium]